MVESGGESVEFRYDTFPDFTFVLGSDGHVVDGSVVAMPPLALDGDATTIGGRDLQRVLPGDSTQRLVQTVTESLSADEPRGLELRWPVRRDDGAVESRWYDVRVAPTAASEDGEERDQATEDGDGRDDAVDGGRTVVVARDVTDTSERLSELEAYRRRMEGAMLMGELAWWEMDVDTRAVRFNDKKATMLGYDPERFTHAEDFTHLLHPDDYDDAMDAMRVHLEGDAPAYEVTYRIMDADGEYRWFHDVGGVTDRSLAGTPKTVTGIVADVTAAKEAESTVRRQRDSIALLTRLLGHGVAKHAAYVVSLLDDVGPAADPDVATAIDDALGASEFLRALADASVDVVDLVTGDADLPVAHVDVRPILETEVARVREVAGEDAVSLDAVPSVWVVGNDLLPAVFGGVLDDAVERADRPRITVSVETSPEAVLVTVADTGDPLSEEQRSVYDGEERSVFDAAPAVVDAYLVVALVESFGGNVHVTESPATDDEGTTLTEIRLELPRAE